jgi:hypothetical protein
MRLTHLVTASLRPMAACTAILGRAGSTKNAAYCFKKASRFRKMIQTKLILIDLLIAGQ